ncbi:MAG: hypothetical protein HYY84_08945 [Deltaproteobacteria bacterium]|nr:hypothetical protein [Deltaproteobacteria bacterium]
MGATLPKLGLKSIKIDSFDRKRLAGTHRLRDYAASVTRRIRGTLGFVQPDVHSLSMK